MRFVRAGLNVVGRILYTGLVTTLIVIVAGIGLFLAFPENVIVAAASVGPQRTGPGSSVPGTWHGDLPYARPVSIVDSIVDTSEASAQRGSWAGQYDPATRAIQVARGASELTLAHEYGHALVHDLLLERCADRGEADALFAHIEALNRSSGPDGLPTWLTETYATYQGVSPTVYGSRYFGDSFGEYLAESFAWYTVRAGTDVAPVTTALLAGMEKLER